MAGRRTEVPLVTREIACTARPLGERAPLPCAAARNALPPAGDAYRAECARNGIHAPFPPFAADGPPPEDPAVTPIPDDLRHFALADAESGTGAYGCDRGVRAGAALVGPAPSHEGGAPAARSRG